MNVGAREKLKGAAERPDEAGGTKPPKEWCGWGAQAGVLLGFIGLCGAAAGVGGWLTASSVNGWYQTLAKPDWTPPDWVFGPVWSALYLGMAVSAWLVWRAKGWRETAGPLMLFVGQLALNVTWSGLFFGLRNPGAACLELVLLWCAVGATMLAFRPISRPAMWLLAPYLAWSSYALALNWAIWRLNA